MDGKHLLQKGTGHRAYIRNDKYGWGTYKETVIILAQPGVTAVWCLLPQLAQYQYGWLDVEGEKGNMKYIIKPVNRYKKGNMDGTQPL